MLHAGKHVQRLLRLRRMIDLPRSSPLKSAMVLHVVKTRVPFIYFPFPVQIQIDLCLIYYLYVSECGLDYYKNLEFIFEAISFIDEF